METLQDISILVIQAFQTLSPVLDDLTKLFSFFGTPGFYILLIPTLYWIVGKRLGATTLLALILSTFICLALKQLLHQPRPYWLGEVLPLSTATSYAIPSTNASDSLVVLGFLAYRLNKDWLWAASGLGVVLIGFSRLYLGLNFPLGILMGWLLGLCVIFLFIHLEERPLPRWTSLPGWGQAGLAFGASVLMILIGWGISLWIAQYPDPAAWAGYATQARSLTEYFIFAGALFGAVCGILLMKRYADFKTSAAISKTGDPTRSQVSSLLAKAARLILGFAGVLVIYTHIGRLIEQVSSPESISAYLLHYLQAGLLMFWVIFLVPWLFVRFGLAKRQGKLKSE